MRPAQLEAVTTARHPFDAVDLAFAVLGAISAPLTPAGFGLAIGQYFARRSVVVARALLAAMDLPPEVARHRYAQTLLPGVVKLLPSSDATNTDAAAPEAAERAEQADYDPFDVLPARTAADDRQSLSAALRALPRVLRIADLKPYPASHLALPLGLDPHAQPQWIDLQATTLHIGLYGQSGCGKDNLLRVWFLYLAKANPPDAVQFVFLDGKGDWLTANLAHLAHMFLPPAGGYGKLGDERIRAAITAVDAEAARRQQLITTAGCRTREQYVAKTGQPMPLLIVVATDVMTSIADAVEQLLTALVSKARSLGIRVIVSMQTPTGKDTKWRSNLSTVLAGSLQSGSQDEPALGIAPRDIAYRPSQLPSPQERPGVFIVRAAASQLLVQAPYLDEARFDALCATLLPRLPSPTAESADDFLLRLLGVEASSATDGTSAELCAPGGALFARAEARAPHTHAVRDNTNVRAHYVGTADNLVVDDAHAHAAPTIEEAIRLAKALTLRANGLSKEQAIKQAFACTKGGGNRAWLRASWLFDQARLEQ